MGLTPRGGDILTLIPSQWESENYLQVVLADRLRQALVRLNSENGDRLVFHPRKGRGDILWPRDESLEDSADGIETAREQFHQILADLNTELIALRVCEKIAIRPSTSSGRTARYLNIRLGYTVRGEPVEP